MFLTKTMNLYSGSTDKPKVFILSSTGVAAINIYEITINSGLSIPPNVNGYFYQGFHISKELDCVIYIWRYLLLLLMKYQWFQMFLQFIYIKDEIFGSPESQRFSYLSIIVVGNLLQLSSIKYPKYLKNIKVHLVTFSIYGQYY